MTDNTDPFDPRNFAAREFTCTRAALVDSPDDDPLPRLALDVIERDTGALQYIVITFTPGAFAGLVADIIAASGITGDTLHRLGIELIERDAMDRYRRLIAAEEGTNQ